jgi:hypothetical protein
VDVLALDAEAGSVAGEPEDAPETGVTPDNLAYLIFTSGSTGRPKGVAIQHRGTAIFLHFMREIVPGGGAGVGARGDLLQLRRVRRRGLRHALLGREAGAGRQRARPAFRGEQDVSLVVTVPTAAAELLRRGAIPRSVRAFNLAGESLAAELAQGLYGLGHVTVVRNLYGPTEDTTYSTWALVPRGSDSVRIGRSVAGSQAYVLDGRMQPQPPGVPGELYLAGEGLARGYSGRPELTAERFVPNPFGEPGSRMYRVMDRARWRPDGELEYLGRTDHQVKVRGFRIELGEIEVVLERYEGVHEVVVVALGDASGDLRLVAYVVPVDGEVSAAELQAHLRGHLPEYMVPSAFVVLKELPLTGSGKVDRRALPAPESSGGAREYVAPRTPVEELLAGFWGEVLRVERVGVEDDFFGLGGALPAGDKGGLAGAAGVRGGAAAAGALRGAPPWPGWRGASTCSGPAAGGRRRRRWWPCRGRLAAAAVLRAAAAVVHRPAGAGQRRVQHALRAAPAGPLRPAVLERAVTEIVRRHETLRTVFATVDGEPVQVVRDAAPVALPVTDLRSLPGGVARGGGAASAREEAVAAVRPGAGPLLRVSAVRLDEAEWGVLFTMHHIVSDGWSMGVLIREVSALYDALAEGREAGAPGAAGAVRRLRRLAARLAHGRDAGGRARLLARTAARALRPCWSCRRTGRAAGAGPRGASVGVDLPRSLARAAGALAARGGDGVHDAAGGLAAPAVALRGGGGRQRGHAHRRAHAPGDGAADRLLRQHAGPAHRPLGRARRSASCWLACGRRRWGRTSTRRSPSSAWWRSWRRSGAWPTRRCSR